MNKDKIKYLYQERYQIKNVYDWENSYYQSKYNLSKPEYLLSRQLITKNQIIDDWRYYTSRDNMPFYRRKSNYKKLMKFNVTCKEFGIKGISKETLQRYDSWEDDPVSSYGERKSWKRNSKRKHQWKDK